MTKNQQKIPGLAEAFRNHKEFIKIEAELDREHHGKYALFSKGKFICVVDNTQEGAKRGYDRCGGDYSLHEIGDEVADNKHCGSIQPYTLEELEEEGFV